MLTQRFTLWAFTLGVAFLNAGAACSQNYPNKPIRIVTADAGGGTDFAARITAQALASSLGQQLIVDNKGAGVVPGETAAKAPADGYTLLVIGSNFWIAPLLQKAPYDPVKDFAPISLETMSPNILVAHPALPVRSVKDLIALAKAKPGALNYASSAPGSASHFASELFKVMAGINMVGIPYKGAGRALTDLIGGHVQLMFATSGSVAPHITSGKLRALAVTSAERSALDPSLPTVAASGLPGYESGTMYGMLAPARTPETLINRLHQELVRALARPEVKEKFLSVGAEVVGSSPEQFAALIKSEMAKFDKVIKSTGIQAQ